MLVTPGSERVKYRKYTGLSKRFEVAGEYWKVFGTRTILSAFSYYCYCKWPFFPLTLDCNLQPVKTPK